MSANPAQVNPTSVDFGPLHIICAYGQSYVGVRPSVIPKPFKSATVILNGRCYLPGLPKGFSEDQVIGYDAAVRVGLNMGSDGKPLGGDKAYRLITLLKGGARWSRLVFPNGEIKEEWI